MEDMDSKERYRITIKPSRSGYSGRSEEDMKKYKVIYTSGSTGYGWEREFDRISEFEYLVRELGREYHVSVKVWDNDIKDFIYWKDCLTYKCDVDMLHSYDRDLRTIDRKRKSVI